MELGFKFKHYNPITLKDYNIESKAIAEPGSWGRMFCHNPTQLKDKVLFFFHKVAGDGLGMLKGAVKSLGCRYVNWNQITFRIKTRFRFNCFNPPLLQESKKEIKS